MAGQLYSFIDRTCILHSNSMKDSTVRILCVIATATALSNFSFAQTPAPAPEAAPNTAATPSVGNASGWSAFNHPEFAIGPPAVAGESKEGRD